MTPNDDVPNAQVPAMSDRAPLMIGSALSNDEGGTKMGAALDGMAKYESAWFRTPWLRTDGIKTIDELVAAVGYTIRELQGGIRTLQEMRDGGVRVCSAESGDWLVVLNTSNPTVAAKYGFEPVEDEIEDANPLDAKVV